jgi:hypothetical protein
MEMAWTSYVGFRVSKWIFLLLLLTTEVQAQTIIARQSVERQMAGQFIDEQSDQSYLFTLYDNRFGDVQSFDMVDLTGGKTWQYTIPQDHYWVGLHHYANGLGLILVQYSIALDSIYFKELLYNHDEGWNHARVLGSLYYSAKNRCPQLQLLEEGDWIAAVSRQATYSSKELMTVRWKKEGSELKSMQSMFWQLQMGEGGRAVSRWQLDGMGNLWVMSGNNREPRPKRDLSDLVKAELVHLDMEHRHVQQWDLVLGQRNLREVFFQEEFNGRHRCVCTFSNSGQERIDGMIVYDLDIVEGDVVAQKVVPFPISGEAVPWIGEYLISDSTGGFWLFGESYFYREIRTVDRYNMQMTTPSSTQLYEYFEEIYAVHVLPNLALEGTVSVIPKKQQGTELVGASYSVAMPNGSPLLRFNDHRSSKPEEGVITEWSGHKSVTRSYAWDNGQWKTTAQPFAEGKENGGGSVLRMPEDRRDGKIGIFLSGNYFLICKE